MSDAAAVHDGHDAAATVAFGFWIYIMSDCVLFAAVFAGFAVLGRSYAGGPTGAELFSLPYVLGETLFLLSSSVTYGFAMLAMQGNLPRRVLAWLALTLLLGLGFIAMELSEFGRLVMAGDGPQRSGFLSAFFTLVGTHGAHVSLGLVWIATMIGQVAVKGLGAPVRSRLLRLSIFWHFLDIVWIGVFSIVYLLGVL